MNLEQVIKDTNDKKISIEGQYNKYIAKINEWKKELEDIPNKYSQNSKQYQEQQKKRLENKISDAQTKAEEWLEQQLNNVEKWLIEKQNDITEQLEKVANDLLAAREEFTKNNE